MSGLSILFLSHPTNHSPASSLLPWHLDTGFHFTKSCLLAHSISLPFSFSIFAFSFASKVNLWFEMWACFAIPLHWVAVAQKPTAKLIVQLQVSFLFLQLSIWPAFLPCLPHTYLFNFNKTFMFCNALWLCPDTDFFFIWMTIFILLEPSFLWNFFLLTLPSSSHSCVHYWNM